MKGRGDVPFRPSCAVITLIPFTRIYISVLNLRIISSHGKSRICFSVPNLRIISSHGKSQMSTGCLCHEICEFFFFTRKVTDVHVRFMSRDCESFFFTQQVTDVSGSLVKEKSVTSRDIPCETKKRYPNILFLFTTTKVEINSLTREQLRSVFPSECHCVV